MRILWESCGKCGWTEPETVKQQRCRSFGGGGHHRQLRQPSRPPRLSVFRCVLLLPCSCCGRVAFFSFRGSPQAAFYILQHSKTMSLRFRQQCQTAQAVAEMLEAHEKVRRVGPQICMFLADSKRICLAQIQVSAPPRSDPLGQQCLRSGMMFFYVWMVRRLRKRSSFDVCQRRIGPATTKTASNT